MWLSSVTQWKWIILLFGSLLVAVIPGILLAPYSINFFDEPYQILNAYDWKNAVYSPLSAFLAHFWGCISDWRYLSFRYLHLILIFMSVFISSIYYLKHCRNKSSLIVVACFSLYFATGFKSDLNLYGWDSWTILFITILLVCFLSFFRNPSFGKILLLSFISSIAILSRIPNASLPVILSGLLIFAPYRRLVSKKKAILYFVLYIVITVFCKQV